MVSLIHPGCNANVKAVAKALDSSGKLHALYTSIASKNNLFKYRKYGGVNPQKIKTLGYREWMRLLSVKLSINCLTKHEKGIFCVDRVWAEIDRWASGQISAETNLVYAYEDAAYYSFRKASTLGIKKVYDLPIGHWKAALKIYEEERELFPEFSPLIQGLKDSSEKNKRKDEELGQSDRVHACSCFVQSTLIQEGYPREKIQVMQFGAPQIQSLAAHRKYSEKKPLKIIFVGRIDQRKGIGYLLKSMQHFDPLEVELHVIGGRSRADVVLNPYRHLFHDHGVMSQEKVWEWMRSCDLFVFPSLFEGQALVVLEAMACGLPVIVTPHVGVSEVVREGIDGFTIPIRSIDQIVEKINWMKDHRERCFEMGLKALERSKEFTWEQYQGQILRSIDELL